MNTIARLTPHRTWMRIQLPVTLLIALLQRSPVVHLIEAADEFVTASPMGNLLRSSIAAVASLGTLHSLAGATTMVTTQPSPLSATVGTPITSVGFTVSNTINIASWKIGGTLPPGLTLSAVEGGTPLTGPGTLDATTPGQPDGYGGTIGGITSTTPILTGTPTQAGQYTMNLQAYEFAGLTGLVSNTFNYIVNVSSAAVATAPAITTQPQSQIVTVGANVTFTAAASGSPTPTYQWQKGGTSISGATSATLTLTSVQLADAASYTVVATNSVSSATSNSAVLTVNAPAAAPVFTTQPLGQAAFTGANITFTATASGSPAPTYQWRKDSVDIPGATGSALTLNNVQTTDAATYTVVATNSVGTTGSSSAVLTVSISNSYLSNLSVRAAMAGGQTLIVGFVVNGGAKPILIRADGPVLNRYGLVGVVDPSLTLYNGGTVEAVNDNWDASLATTFATLGAFAFDAGSKDSALEQTINGPHTAQATATGAGTILVEAYDAGPNDGRKLVNLSARFQVGTGDNILIAGFVISGTGTMNVLVRAVGPTLASYGVTGTLVDPQLALYDGGTVIASNDNWSSSLTPIFDSVGAFHLLDASKDAALVVTLQAGKPYTVQVSGVGGTTGEALIEIYMVP